MDSKINFMQNKYYKIQNRNFKKNNKPKSINNALKINTINPKVPKYLHYFPIQSDKANNTGHIIYLVTDYDEGYKKENSLSSERNNNKTETKELGNDYEKNRTYLPNKNIKNKSYTYQYNNISNNKVIKKMKQKKKILNIIKYSLNKDKLGKTEEKNKYNLNSFNCPITKQIQEGAKILSKSKDKSNKVNHRKTFSNEENNFGILNNNLYDLQINTKIINKLNQLKNRKNNQNKKTKNNLQSQTIDIYNNVAKHSLLKTNLFFDLIPENKKKGKKSKLSNSLDKLDNDILRKSYNNIFKNKYSDDLNSSKIMNKKFIDGIKNEERKISLRKAINKYNKIKSISIIRNENKSNEYDNNNDIFSKTPDIKNKHQKIFKKKLEVDNNNNVKNRNKIDNNLKKYRDSLTEKKKELNTNPNFSEYRLYTESNNNTNINEPNNGMKINIKYMDNNEELNNDNDNDNENGNVVTMGNNQTIRNSSIDGNDGNRYMDNTYFEQNNNNQKLFNEYSNCSTINNVNKDLIKINKNEKLKCIKKIYINKNKNLSNLNKTNKLIKNFNNYLFKNKINSINKKKFYINKYCKFKENKSNNVNMNINVNRSIPIVINEQNYNKNTSTLYSPLLTKENCICDLTNKIIDNNINNVIYSKEQNNINNYNHIKVKKSKHLRQLNTDGNLNGIISPTKFKKNHVFIEVKTNNKKLKIKEISLDNLNSITNNKNNKINYLTISTEKNNEKLLKMNKFNNKGYFDLTKTYNNNKGIKSNSTDFFLSSRLGYKNNSNNKERKNYKYIESKSFKKNIITLNKKNYNYYSNNNTSRYTPRKEKISIRKFI